MISYLKSYLRLRHDRRGVTATEYGLIAALVGLTAAIGLTKLGVDMNAVFKTLGTAIGT